MNLQDLESCFNLVCKIRDGIIMMARANNNANTPQVRNINNKYNMLYNEIMLRLDTLNDKIIDQTETEDETIN